MNSFLRALHAERLKLRKTLALWLCVLAPILAVIFGTFAAYSGPLAAEPSTSAHWRIFDTTIFGIWASFMLPLFVTLESALLAGLEHSNSQWKHLIALPLPHGVHYLAKLVSLVAVTILASLMLAILIPIAGWLLVNFAEAPGLATTPPLAELAKLASYVSIGSLSMVAIQCFVALRWSSFTVATTFGIVTTMAALFIPGRQDAGLSVIPWKIPVLLVNSPIGHEAPMIIASALGFALVSFFGYWEFSRREWT